MTVRLFLIIMTLLLCACQAPLSQLGNPELPYPPTREPQVGDIFHPASGYYVSQQTMLDHIMRAQVIFVGETHDNPAAHRLQEKILTALYQHNPEHVTLAMEMFTPSQQPVIDRWTAGELSEEEFIEAVGWNKGWSMDFGYYRPLLDLCRKNHIKILALNTERSTRKMVSATPLNQLSAGQKAQIPKMDLNDPYHQAMMDSYFSGHSSAPMPSSMIGRFKRVQTLWDETMAANLATYLKRHDSKQQVVVIAGGNHIRYGFGIPRRLFRRIPVSYLLIGSEEIDIPEDKQDRLMNIDKPAHYPMRPYDFVTFTRYEDLNDDLPKP